MNSEAFDRFIEGVRSEERTRFAKEILAELDRHLPSTNNDAGKNPHAVALGKFGGATGGYARAKALSRGRRIEIAKEAAAARWDDKKKHGRRTGEYAEGGGQTKKVFAVLKYGTKLSHERIAALSGVKKRNVSHVLQKARVRGKVKLEKTPLGNVWYLVRSQGHV